MLEIYGVDDHKGAYHTYQYELPIKLAGKGLDFIVSRRNKIFADVLAKEAHQRKWRLFKQVSVLRFLSIAALVCKKVICRRFSDIKILRTVLVGFLMADFLVMGTSQEYMLRISAGKAWRVG